MKKIIMISIIVFVIGFLLAFSKDKNDYLKSYFTEEEIEFIENENIEFSYIAPYLKYKNFNVFNFYDYEKIRDDTHFYLEAINLWENKDYYTAYENTLPALFQGELKILVNKHFYLEKSYVPNDLDNLENYNLDYVKRENETMQGSKEALHNLEEMFSASRDAGFDLIVYSAYRSYEKQEYLYYVVNMQNDNYSAKPGYSEHQTGLAFDISTALHGLTINFSSSEVYNWLIENSYKFGFILRYPQDKENLTLYKFEPWHFRYVGKSVALNIYNNNYCYEEFIIKNYTL